MIQASLVLCVYNGEKYLRECFDSILNQDCDNFEIIIVNDASTDLTAQILDEYSRVFEHLKIINNKSNIGLTKSLNIALSFVRSNIVVRLDADDKMTPNRLSDTIKIFDSYPNIDLLFGSAFLINNKSEIIGRSRWLPNLLVWYYIHFGNIFVHGAMAFKLHIDGHRVQYDENYIVAQDYIFIRTYIKKQNFLFLRKPIYYLRIHEMSISKKKYIQQIDTLLSYIYPTVSINYSSKLKRLFHKAFLLFIYSKSFVKVIKYL